MTEFELSKAPKGIDVIGRFDNTCHCQLSVQAMQAICDGRLKLHIQQIGGNPIISNARIVLASIFGNIRISIGADDASVIFGGDTSGYFDLRLWRTSSITINANTTSNGLIIVCDMSTVTVGKDCMFSDGVLIQSADQHGIVDLQSGQIVNNTLRKVHIEDHVWLGRQCTLLADIAIGKGSIIGTGAIVTKDIPEMSIAAGIPAKVVKSNRTWSRSPIMLDAMAETYINAVRPIA